MIPEIRECMRCNMSNTRYTARYNYTYFAVYGKARIFPKMFIDKL